MRRARCSVALAGLPLLPLVCLILAAAIDTTCLAAGTASPKDRPTSNGSCDLRPIFDRHGLTVGVQGSRNTCSVFTMAGAVEYALVKKRGKSEFRLSVEFLNWASNRATGVPGDGSYFSDLWTGLTTYGACPEADMPYRQEFDAELQPSAEAMSRARPLREAGLHLHWIKRWDPTRGASDQQLEKIKRVLCKGWPVCGGFLWPKAGRAEWTNGVLAMRPRDQMRDGHSVLLVGYRDDPAQPGGGVFLIRDSDASVADEKLSYEYIRAYMNDALWIDFTPQTSQAESKRPRQKAWWLD